MGYGYRANRTMPAGITLISEELPAEHKQEVAVTAGRRRSIPGLITLIGSDIQRSFPIHKLHGASQIETAHDEITATHPAPPPLHPAAPPPPDLTFCSTVPIMR